ncbi:TPA: GIY-YIG nuclease family protein [Enterobacter hormaechei]
MTKKISRKDMEVAIKHACRDSAYEFVRWDDQDRGMESRFICSCPHHGDWRVSARMFLREGTRCRRCAYALRRERFRLTEHEAEQRVHSQIKDTEWSFNGWVSGYRNKDSKMLMACKTHGSWEPSFHNFTRQDTGCPGCAKSGYDPNKPAYLYALVSADGGAIKVGISNNFKVRLYGLRHATPFRFEVAGVVALPGWVARNLEKDIHNRYEAAGFSGFGGATEWLKFDNNILTEFRLMEL